MISYDSSSVILRGLDGFQPTTHVGPCHNSLTKVCPVWNLIVKLVRKFRLLVCSNFASARERGITRLKLVTVYHRLNKTLLTKREDFGFG